MSRAALGRPGRGVRIGVVLCTLALVGEGTLRVARFGPSRAAIGPWSVAPPWSALRTLDERGDPVLRPHADARWALAPGQPVVRYRLNALGLREDADPAPRPAPGVCRILTVGDAYTFGYGVAARDTYPRRLARRLAPVRAVEVLNGGVPNLHVGQERRRLAALLPRLAPDVVLASFSWWDVVPAPETPPPPRWSRAWLARGLEARVAALGGSIGLVDRGFRLVRHALTPAFCEPSGLAREIAPLAGRPEDLGARWTATQAAIAGMAADARAAGARFALVVTPLDLEVRPERRRLYREERLPYPAHGFRDVDYASTDAMPRALAAFAAREGIPLIDTTPAFRRRRAADLFLRGDYHAGPAGHRLIARETARWVVATQACAGTERSRERSDRHGVSDEARRGVDVRPARGGVARARSDAGAGADVPRPRDLRG